MPIASYSRITAIGLLSILVQSSFEAWADVLGPGTPLQSKSFLSDEWCNELWTDYTSTSEIAPEGVTLSPQGYAGSCQGRDVCERAQSENPDLYITDSSCSNANKCCLTATFQDTTGSVGGALCTESCQNIDYELSDSEFDFADYEDISSEYTDEYCDNYIKRSFWFPGVAIDVAYRTPGRTVPIVDTMRKSFAGPCLADAHCVRAAGSGLPLNLQLTTDCAPEQKCCLKRSFREVQGNGQVYPWCKEVCPGAPSSPPSDAEEYEFEPLDPGDDGYEAIPPMSGPDLPPLPGSRGIETDEDNDGSGVVLASDSPPAALIAYLIWAVPTVATLIVASETG